MNNTSDSISKAFPKRLERNVKMLCKKINFNMDFQMSDCFSVFIEDEILRIPYRIYEKPYGTDFESVFKIFLSRNEFLILNCLFSRHHNGFVRQKSLKNLISSNEYWITPFIFQFLGEYLIQILDEIEKNLNEHLLQNLVNFSNENEDYFNLTKQRLISYWNCYYRNYGSKKEDYVGFRIISDIEKHKIISK